MFVDTVKIRVRYGETDQMGYLYYGNYAQYYEVGRVEAMRKAGMTYKDMEAVHGIWMPVVNMEVRYIRPAFYDDLLTVKTEIRKLPDTHIVFNVEVFNEAEKLINVGMVRLCFFDAATKKVIPAPEYFLKNLRPYFPDNSVEALP